MFSSFFNQGRRLMFHRMYSAFVAAVCCSVLFGASASAGPLSGGVDFKSQYVLADLYVQTDGLVLQPYAELAIRDSGCAVGVWASVGLETKVGNEVDLTASCKVEISNQTTVTGLVSRYLLFYGVPDMTEISILVVHGSVDVTASHLHLGWWL